MEVASPLPFPPSQAGTKRPFACSPGHSPLHGMESTADDYAQHMAKRRRFNSNENMEPSILNASSQASSFFSAASPLSKGPFNANGLSLKRNRSDINEGNNWSQSDASSVVNDLKRVVDTQAVEIENLKANKASLECSLNEVRAAHDKAVNENKILKKAVTIQQERQNQAASEIEDARRFKVDAEDKIKRLEQMCLSLQYHLQAQHSNTPGNDFMGCPPQPPDVY